MAKVELYHSVYQYTLYKRFIPEYCYFYVQDKKVQVGDKVYKGTLLGKDVYSSISGEVVKDKGDYIIIKNDKNDTTLPALESQDTYLDIKSCNIYVEKINIADLIKNSSIIVINALDNDAYLYSHEAYVPFKKEEIITFIKEVKKIADLKIYLLTYQDSKILTKYSDISDLNILTYPRYYSPFIEDSLKKKLKSDFLLIDALDAIFIGERLLYNVLPSYTIISIYDEEDKKQEVLYVPVGTLLSALLTDYNLKNKIISNGTYKWIELKLNDLVSFNLRNIYLSKIKDVKSSSCVHCSKCIYSCPKGFEPILSLKRGVPLPSDICSKCNICSLVCPSNIDFQKISRRIKNESN